MSKWVTGKDLMAYWDIEGFELFDCLKKGLQPFTWHGKKIIDTDTLGHDRKMSLEQCIGLIHGAESTGKVVYPGGGRYQPLTGQQIAQRGKKFYESQPLKPINPPPHHMSFTLPDDSKKALYAIEKAMALKFKQSEVLEFAEKNGYPNLNIDNASGTPDTSFYSVKTDPAKMEQGQEAQAVTDDAVIGKIRIRMLDEEVELTRGTRKPIAIRLNKYFKASKNRVVIKTFRKIVEYGSILCSNDKEAKSVRRADEKIVEILKSELDLRFSPQFTSIKSEGNRRYRPLFLTQQDQNTGLPETKDELMECLKEALESLKYGNTDIEDEISRILTHAKQKGMMSDAEIQEVYDYQSIALDTPGRDDLPSMLEGLRITKQP